MKSIVSLIIFFVVSLVIFSCENNDLDNLIPSINSDSQVSYIDELGEAIINPQFKDATGFSEGLALVKSSFGQKKWGYIGIDGVFKINPNYKQATIYSEDVAWVVSDNAAPTAINKEGEIIFSLKNASSVRVYKDGLAAFSQVIDGKSKWGFVDKQGIIVIKPLYANVKAFYNGKCAVQNESRNWGYINTSGSLLIDFKFEDAQRFVNGSAIVKLNDLAGVINTKGEYLLNPQFTELEFDKEDKYLFNQNGKWGWCDKRGKYIINPQFDVAGTFGDALLAPVELDNKWGYINMKGNFVINPAFEFALPFTNNYALVYKNEKWGTIDPKGHFLLAPQIKIPFHYFYSKINNEIHKEEDYLKLFQQVSSDYFDVDNILSHINLENPGGMFSDSRLTDLMVKFKISENQFSQYSDKHQVFSKDISKDASVYFYAVVSPFKEKPSGWYTKMVFDRNSEIQGFVYTISLKETGKGKETELKEAIENLLKNYKKEYSTIRESVFTNKSQLISIYTSQNKVTIKIEEN